MVLRIDSADPWEAVARASEIVRAIVARLAVGAHLQLVPLPSAWVAGEKSAFRLEPSRRGVDVGSLDREANIYVVESSSAVDSALELLAPLDDAPPGPAVSGAWAAIESLLVGPGDGGDRVIAADRLATLVACSWPRAELTTLAYRHANGPADEWCMKIRTCRTNRERAGVAVDALMAGAALHGEGSDIAASARMRVLLASPKSALAEVRDYVAVAIRRLYRQRNLVLHWGRTQGVAVRPCLRTAAPLVGAGIDRIAHAWFTDKTSPLELSARAAIRLEQVGTAAGRNLLDLLEQ
jgi:hypothetical protein